jgi:hypothetical protein
MKKDRNKVLCICGRPVFRSVFLVFALVPVLCPAPAASSGLPDWASVNGYFDQQQIIVVSRESQFWTTGNITQNRIEASLYPSRQISIASALRTRLLYGGLYEQLFPLGFKRSLDVDPGLVDLTANIWDNNSAVLTAMFDRLYADYSAGDWQVRIGRHRINWGKDLIWNPNDIFNAQSFLDVSYREGPGTDALLARRYLGPMAHVEAAVAGARNADSITAAAAGQINIGGFDLQMIAGWMRHDIVAGGGFSGQVWGAAVRGEGTLFMPDSMNDSPQDAACLSIDYTFPRQVRFLISGLYNSSGRKSPANAFTTLFNERITAKNLSPARYQALLQFAYPLTPLINTECSALVNPYDGSTLLMPRIAFSISESAEAVFQAFLQAGSAGSQFNGTEHAVFGDLRWCF